MSSHVKPTKILTQRGIAMFHVWALGYASVEEVAGRLGATQIKTDKLLAPLVKDGILQRVRVEGRWYYSMNPEWVRTNTDMAMILEAVEYLQRSREP